MTNLKAAFKVLRAKGYFAKQNFQCCQSCGWDAVPEENADNAVFYSIQDNENLKAGEHFCISWSGNAHEIIGILHTFGLICEWDGTPETRICIENFSVMKIK